MGNTRDTQYSRDAQAHADQLAAPSRSLTTKAVVLAAVLALIAAVAFVGAMGRDANAFIPDPRIGTGNGGKPTVTATMQNPDNYSDVGEDLSFKYEGTVTFSNVKPASKGEYTFTVSADSKAPFKANPDTGNIVFLSQNVDISVVSSNNRVVTYKLTPNDNFSGDTIEVDFSGGGRLKQSVLDENKARIVSGSISARYEPSAEADVVAWEGNDSPAGPDGKRFEKKINSCTGTAEYAYKLPAGGYLMDIKWADAKGVGSIEYGGKPTIEYYSPSSTTPSALPEAGTYIRPDPTPPYYGALDPLVTDNPDARWIDSHNWRFNPATSTGSLWLPAGSGIKVTREVTFNSCTEGVASGPNFNPVRDNEILNVVEIGNNAVPVSAGSTSSFLTPGVVEKVNLCENVWAVEHKRNPDRVLRIGMIEGLPDHPTIEFKDNYRDKSIQNLVYK